MPPERTGTVTIHDGMCPLSGPSNALQRSQKKILRKATAVGYSKYVIGKVRAGLACHIDERATVTQPCH